MYDVLYNEFVKHKLSYQEAARIAEIKPTTLATRLSGLSEFKLPELWKFADYFNCMIDYLVGREVANK